MGLRYSDGGQTLVATTSKGLWVLDPKTGKVRLKQKMGTFTPGELGHAGDTTCRRHWRGTADGNTGAVELWDLKRGRSPDHR